MAGRLAERQSRSSTSVAPAPPAASHWRRAAASRRTARRSLAACPRIGTTFCRRASTWPCARSWGAIRRGAPRTWISSRCASPLCFLISFVCKPDMIQFVLVGSVAGSGGVAARRGTAALLRLVAASLPRTSRKKRAFPLMSGGAASAGGMSSHRACATAAQHARPHAARLRAHRVLRSASSRAACCPLAMHRASASTAAMTGAEGALSPPLESHECV